MKKKWPVLVMAMALVIVAMMTTTQVLSMPTSSDDGKCTLNTVKVLDTSPVSATPSPPVAVINEKPKMMATAETTANVPLDMAGFAVNEKTEIENGATNINAATPATSPTPNMVSHIANVNWPDLKRTQAEKMEVPADAVNREPTVARVILEKNWPLRV